MRILIRLPHETQDEPPFKRSAYGRMVLEDEGKILLGPYPCLGKGQGSRYKLSRDWQQKGNDTPTGEYVGTVVSWHPAEKYGPFPSIKLDPIGGNARRAEELGRSGLAIHGGRKQTDLVPTEGCVRVFDRNMEAIQAKLKQLGLTEINVTVEEY